MLRLHRWCQRRVVCLPSPDSKGYRAAIYIAASYELDSRILRNKPAMTSLQPLISVGSSERIFIVTVSHKAMCEIDVTVAADQQINELHQLLRDLGTSVDFVV